MAIKVTGAEFKRFYDDGPWWTGETFHEDADLSINGTLRPDGIDSDSVQDTDEVTISGGVMLGPEWEEGEGPSLEEYFERWRKAQTTEIFSVECDKTIVDAVKAAIRQAGGKV